MSTYFQLVADNKLDEVRRALPVHARARDSHGKTALMLAASRGLPQMVDLLAQHELRMQDASGRTALMYAASRGYYFDALAPELRMQSRSGETALMAAVANGSVAVCQKLQKERGLCAAAGYTATTLARALQNDQIAELLGETSAVFTPLMEAACAGRPFAAQYQQFVSRKDEQGRTALFYALDAKNAEMARNLLIEKNVVDQNGTTALMKAAQANLKDFLETFKGQLKSIDQRGRTALMYACEAGAKDCVEFLLAEAKMQDSEGRSAAMYAAQNAQLQCLSLVISQEAAIVDSRKRNLMHYCVMGNLQENIVSQIVESFQNNVDDEGKTAFAYACELNRTDVLELLQQYEGLTYAGKNVNPAMLAAQRDSAEALELIIKAYRKQRDDDGRSLADHALQADAARCIPLILELDPEPQVLIRAAAQNRYRVCKAISDVARYGSTSLSQLVYSTKQQSLCRGEMHSVTKNFENYQNGFSALFIAIQAGSNEAVRVLAPGLSGKTLKDGTTALMFYCQSTFQLDRPARRALVQHCAGRQLKDGTTALMLACFAHSDNIEIIRELAEFERDLVNNAGQSALDFATNSGRQDAVEVLKAQ